ncbi:MAG: hypothetical protein Q4D65_10230 [Peptostreptococcaceae bacterium]|nr:hypothetical protein [Peptostreptococcaceae bacterium]
MFTRKILSNHGIKNSFFVLLFLFCILLSGCNSKIKFEKSQDEFSTTYKSEQIEVNIASNVENPEEIFVSIERDLNIINNFEPIEKLSIHINEKFLKGNDKSGVECNGEFVKTPEFKQLLISNAYGLYDNWKSVGIYGNLFADEMNTNVFCTNATNKITEQNKTKNEKQNTNQASNSANEERESKSEEKNQSTNTNTNTKDAEPNSNQNIGGKVGQNADSNKVDFASYYQNHDFSLFGAHFFPDFSSEEEIQNLTHASTSLVKYLLDNEQKEKLLNEEISIEDIKPWAEQNNIDLTYLEELYNHINEIKVSNPSAFEKLYIDTRRDMGGFSMHIITDDKDYDTASELERIIKLYDEMIVENLDVIREQAPNFYKEYAKELTQIPKVIYTFDNKEMWNYYLPKTTKIFLRNVEAQMVEYNHLLLEYTFVKKNSFKNRRPQWLIEGLDAYMGMVHSKAFRAELKNLIFKPIDMDSIKDPREIEFLNLERKLFLQNIPEKERLNLETFLEQRVNVEKILHIFFASSLSFDDYFDKVYKGNNTVFMHYSVDEKYFEGIHEPNRQNFHANISFVMYLVKEYGLEKMLYFGVQDFDKITFEEYFGKSYKELEADWKQYLIDNIEGGELLVYGDKGGK